MKTFFEQLKNKNPLSIKQALFALLAVISLFVLLQQSKTAAISGDEYRYIKQSAKVYKYFETKGEDKSAITQKGIDPQHFNSQSFDVILYTLEKKLNIKDTFRFRHGANALTGWLAILFTALIAMKLWGVEAGILTFILLLASPRFIGHSFNNHRDIPLALSFAFTVYSLLLLLLHKESKKYLKLGFIALGIASAYSLRLAGGVLLSAFVLFFYVIFSLDFKKIGEIFNAKNINLMARHTLLGVVVLIVGYFLGILIWPFGLEGPIENALVVFRESSSLGVSLNQLFEGQLVQSSSIPWYYTPKFMLITIPLVVLAGLALYFLMHTLLRFKKFGRLEFVIVGFALLPLIYTVLFTKNDYGGWRHFIFVYPFIVLMGTRGLMLLYDFFNQNVIKYVLLAMGIVLVGLPMSFNARNHPYQYVYFNELVGGVSKAYTSYESDYSCNGILSGSDWIIANVLPKLKEGEKITLATNYSDGLNAYMKDYKDQVKVIYTRYYSKSEKDWDYAIYYCGYISPQQLREGYWPPHGTVYTHYVDDFPICSVVKRPSHEDYLGFKALKENKEMEALEHFNNYLKINPESEEVLDKVASLMLSAGQFEDVKHYAKQAIKYNDRQLSSYLYLAIASNATKDYKSALKYCDEMENIRRGISQVYYQKGIAYRGLNKPNEAFKEFQKAITYNPKDALSFLQMVEMFINYRNYDNALQVLQKMESTIGPNITSVVLKAKCIYLKKDTKGAAQLLAQIPEKFHGDNDYVKLRMRIALDQRQEDWVMQYMPLLSDMLQDSEAQTLLGRVALFNGQNAEAIQYFNQALRISQDNQEAIALLTKHKK